MIGARMTRFLWIVLAGAAGTGARYGVNLFAARSLGVNLPWGTFIVNVVGCFLMSIVAHAAARAVISEDVRLTLATGFMGGLTTYSAFNWETMGLTQHRNLALGLLNAGGTLASCLVAGVLGLALARSLFGS
jgi:CrcB protein